MTALHDLLALIGIGLFLIAYFLPKLSKNPLAQLLQSTQEILSNTPLYAKQEKHYIAIYHNKEKIAILQLDKKITAPIRIFGTVIIITVKQLPNKQQLYNTLKDNQLVITH